MSPDPRSVPHLRPGSEVSRLEGDFVVLDGAGRTLRGLNATAARVWELIDGRRTAEEISRILAREYGVAPEEVLRDVLGFLDVLAEKGLLDHWLPEAGAAGGDR